MSEAKYSANGELLRQLRAAKDGRFICQDNGRYAIVGERRPDRRIREQLLHGGLIIWTWEPEGMALTDDGRHHLEELEAHDARDAAEKAKDTRPLLTTDGAAKRLAVSERTVRNLIQRGELRALQVGLKSRRIEQVEVDRYVARQRESAA